MFTCVIIISFFFLSLSVFAFFFSGGGRTGGRVPAAAATLSASALTVARARILRRQPELIPQRTEVRFLSFGCEEAGMRGAMRYVQEWMYKTIDW